MKGKTILVILVMIASLFYNNKVNAQEMDVCGDGGFKSFMPMTALYKGSPQYKYLANETKDEDNLRVTEDGYYAVAMGSYYGKLGDKFVIMFADGTETKVVKVDEKANGHTSSQCYGKSMQSDGSIIEPILSTGKSVNASRPDLLKKAYFHGNVGLVYKQFASTHGIKRIVKGTTALESEKPNENEEDTLSYQDAIDSFFNHFETELSLLGFSQNDKQEKNQWSYLSKTSYMNNWYSSTPNSPRNKN